MKNSTNDQCDDKNEEFQCKKEVLKQVIGLMITNQTFKGFKTWKDQIIRDREVKKFYKSKGAAKVLEKLKLNLFKDLYNSFSNWKIYSK